MPEATLKRACGDHDENAYSYHSGACVRNEQDYPEWFLWLWEYGFRILILLGAGALIVLLFISDTTDDRLEAIEDHLTEEPPRAYQPPDLASMKASVSPESLRVHQTVYVPAYSHIYYDQGRPYLLETTLSIRNTDMAKPVYLQSVRYYDTSGKLVKEFVNQGLVALGPLETIEFLIGARDTIGGSGANFVVEWAAEREPINRPIVEAVMVGASGTRAISFTRNGQAIRRDAPE